MAKQRGIAFELPSAKRIAQVTREVEQSLPQQIAPRDGASVSSRKRHLGVARIISNDGDGAYTVTVQKWCSEDGEWVDRTEPEALVEATAYHWAGSDTIEEDETALYWEERDEDGEMVLMIQGNEAAASTGPLSGCWRLYIDGTGSGTLDSGDWSDVVLTHWGKAMSNPYDGPLSHASYQGLLYEDDSFNIDYMTPGLYPVILDFEEISSNNFEWEDDSLSYGNIYVDGLDGALKWECTSYTADTLVYYRATGAKPKDIGTPFS
jgi:hypothetical protein